MLEIPSRDCSGKFQNNPGFWGRPSPPLGWIKHLGWGCVRVGRGGGGGGGGSGIFWDSVLEWYMNLYEPTGSRRRNAPKNISFA